MNNTIVAVSGGFDPIHSGHIKMIYQARTLGDLLIVGINSDSWLTRKKGKFFMPFTERAYIVNSIKGVDSVLSFNDDDNTSCDFLIKLKNEYPESHIIFANGGDRTAQNIPEMNIPGIEFKFDVGGGKTASSSEFLKDWLNFSH